MKLKQFQFFICYFPSNLESQLTWHLTWSPSSLTWPGSSWRYKLKICIKNNIQFPAEWII